MALTLNTSGTQTAVIGTEHTLATITTVGVFVCVVDVAAMVLSDTLELRVYYTNLTGGTERLAYDPASYVNAQSGLVKFTPPIPSDISCKFTLKQTAGTGRAFPWKVLAM